MKTGGQGGASGATAESMGRGKFGPTSGGFGNNMVISTQRDKASSSNYGNSNGRGNKLVGTKDLPFSLNDDVDMDVEEKHQMEEGPITLVVTDPKRRRVNDDANTEFGQAQISNNNNMEAQNGPSLNGLTPEDAIMISG